MSRRRQGRDVHGIVLLDKPAGLSSNQAVQKVRWLYQARKAGHTGSLDPFATGMLPVCLGEASKTAGFMLDAAKVYVATARLGQATTTGDTEGEPAASAPVPAVGSVEVEAVLARFQGEIAQVPPMYSALKHRGQPLYRLARAGVEVPRAPRTVTIHALDLLAWEPPLLSFRVHCSKGTYVRTLAEDLARELGSCAHLAALRRLAVAPFGEDAMVSLPDLEARRDAGTLDDCLLPADAGLAHWPRARLDEDAAGRFLNGNPIPGIDAPLGPVRVFGTADRLLGLGEVTPDGRLTVRRVFHMESLNCA
jgi:tRNA pseudouridine55 synthase